MSNEQVFEAFAAGKAAQSETVTATIEREGTPLALGVLYSYGTPVAVKNKARAAYFDARRYSVTTAKQMTRARGTCERADVRVEVLDHDEFRALAERVGADLSRAR